MSPNRAAIIADIRARRAVLELAGRRHRRRGPLPHQQQPDAIRLGYFRALLQVLGQARTLVRRVEPKLEDLVRQRQLERGDARLDMSDEELNELLDRTSEEFFAEFTNTKLAGIAEQYARRTSGFQREQIARQFKSALGIDIIKAEPWLEPRIREFTAENVALIKSIPQRYFEQVEQRVIRGMREGLRWEEIAKNLDERFEVAEGHAKLVARDQVGKFFGELNRQRQKDLGVEKFTWRTARDNRVRESHEQLEGEVFEWANPPTVDDEEAIPGSPIACRCQAEPVLEPILEAIEGPGAATPTEEEPAPAPELPPESIASPAPAPPPLVVEQLEVTRADIIQALAYEDAPTWFAEHGPAVREWRKSLPTTERQALTYYQGAGFDLLNGALREGAVRDVQTTEAVTRVINAAPALNRDVWVWRGLSYSPLATNPEGFLAEKGTKILDKGFLSTSIHARRAILFAGSNRASAVLIHVRVPKGVRAPYLTAGPDPYEYEILLQRNTDLRVTRIMKTKDSYTVLDAEYVGSTPKPLPPSGKVDSAADLDVPVRRKEHREGIDPKFCWTEEDFESGGVTFHK